MLIEVRPVDYTDPPRRGSTWPDPGRASIWPDAPTRSPRRSPKGSLLPVPDSGPRRGSSLPPSSRKGSERLNLVEEFKEELEDPDFHTSKPLLVQRFFLPYYSQSWYLIPWVLSRSGKFDFLPWEKWSRITLTSKTVVLFIEIEMYM